MAEDRRHAVKLVQLPVECPACGKREARRVAEWRLQLYRHLDPDHVVETIRCKCGLQYAIKVGAYIDAAEADLTSGGVRG